MTTDHSDKYLTWDLHWTPQHVQRFWNWMAESPERRDGQYFSRQVGDALLDHISRSITLTGTAIDWGAGAGFLVEELLRRGINTFAFDISENSIAELRGRIGDHPCLAGATSIPDLSDLHSPQADIIFLVETIEHLDDQALAETLSSIRRCLKAGGNIVVTTPNDEDLEENKLACPNCGCVFHRVQHVRSFDRTALQSVMATYGFETVTCNEIRLSTWPKPFRRLNGLRYTLRGRKLPHLVFVGRSQGAS